MKFSSCLTVCTCYPEEKPFTSVLLPKLTRQDLTFCFFFLKEKDIEYHIQSRGLIISLINLQFFSQAGFPCPALRNPSDHFLRCINSDFDKVKATLKGSMKLRVWFFFFFLLLASIIEAC